MDTSLTRWWLEFAASSQILHGIAYSQWWLHICTAVHKGSHQQQAPLGLLVQWLYRGCVDRHCCSLGHYGWPSIAQRDDRPPNEASRDCFLWHKSCQELPQLSHLHSSAQGPPPAAGPPPPPVAPVLGWGLAPRAHAAAGLQLPPALHLMRATFSSMTGQHAMHVGQVQSSEQRGMHATA